jgi:hypothetical protein
MARKQAVKIGYDVTAVKRPKFDGFNRAGRRFGDENPTFVPIDDPLIDIILNERMLNCRPVYGDGVEAVEESAEV